TPVNQVAGYGHPYGYHPLREHIQQALAQHGLHLQTQQILLTQGASQGLDIVTRTLLRPGDIIAVEQPCYANFLQSLRMAGLRVMGVPRDEQGLCLETLESLARKYPVKALFVN